MEVPVPQSAVSALGELRRELQGELQGIVARQAQSGQEGEPHALSKEIESKQRALDLVEATELQLAEQPDLEGEESGASTQVRALAQRRPCRLY
jgi:hypothetical protein